METSDSDHAARSRVVQLALLDAAQHGGPHAVDAILAKMTADPGYVDELVREAKEKEGANP